MSPEPLLLERDGAVARLILNRPDAANTFDVALSRAMLEAVVTCDEDPTIRCVVLTGTGKMFSGGGDVGSFARAGDRMPHLAKEMTAYLHTSASRLVRMPKPVIVAVNGAAAGIGLSFAMLGDIVLAAKSSHYTVAYNLIGLSPDGGATWLLPRLVGLRRAQELMLTNRRVLADEAAAIGLVTRVVEDAALMDEAMALARQLASGATRAIGRTRGLLASSFETSFETQMEMEARAIADSGRDPESRIGIAAFVNKQKPVFPG